MVSSVGEKKIKIKHTVFCLEGPYWTHILFTFTKLDGLKVYINGTLNASDPGGINVSHFYGDPYADLVIGTGNDKAYGHYVTGAFDEFVIWERALPPKDILLYYNAATGRKTGRSQVTGRQSLFAILCP